MSAVAEPSITVRLWEGFKPWLIWLAFTLLGPLAGLVAMLAAGAAWEIFQGGVERQAFLHSPAGWILKFIRMSAFAYPWALLFGRLQAAFVGVVAALSYLGWGRVSFAAIMIASTLAFIGLSLFTFASPRSTESVTLEKLASMALPHLSAGFVCWLIVLPMRRNAATMVAG